MPKFRAIRFNETHHWNLPAVLAGCQVFGVYVFAVGEATYCCSLTPSSWVEFLWNEVVAPSDVSEEMQREIEKLQFETGGEGGYYVPFIRDYSNCSEERECENWDDANESFHANYPSFHN